MAAGPKVDAVAIHWYKGADPKRFIRDVTAVIDAYHKPVWITEYAPQTAADARKNPRRYAENDIERFISETVAWMETEPRVHRYAWHDPKLGNAALFDEAGALTDAGKAYAAAR
jgi:hypothetical protein